MPISDIPLAVLLLPRSAQQIINDSLAFIANPPDPSLVSVRTANWRTGGPYRTLLYRQGIEGSLLYNVLAGFAGSAFLRYATGRWLDWLGQDYFDELRQGASASTVFMDITVPAGAGPIGPVQITVSTTDGKQYQSSALVTLPAGPTVVTAVPFKAAKTGSVYNVGAGNISQLVSPNILGITVTNPAPAIGGFDEETDQRYAQRLYSKWGALSTGSPEAAYIYWALTASPEVIKVKVNANQRGGTFGVTACTTVIVGTAIGPVSAGALAAVTAYIEPRIPLDTVLEVANAVASLRIVFGTVQVFSQYQSVAPAAITESLQRLAARVPIGSYSQGPVPVSEVNRAVAYDPVQVYDLTLTTPVIPISLNYDELLVFQNSTTISPV